MCEFSSKSSMPLCHCEQWFKYISEGFEIYLNPFKPFFCRNEKIYTWKYAYFFVQYICAKSNYNLTCTNLVMGWIHVKWCVFFTTCLKESLSLNNFPLKRRKLEFACFMSTMHVQSLIVIFHAILWHLAQSETDVRVISISQTVYLQVRENSCYFILFVIFTSKVSQKYLMRKGN